MTAITVAPVARAARRAGVDPGPALARLRLNEQGGYEDRIPLSSLFTLWEAMVRATREPALPVLAAQYNPQDEKSLLSFLCSVQQNVHDALHCADTYWDTVGDGYRWTVEHRGATVVLGVPAAPSARLGWRCVVEYDAVDIVLSSRRMSGGVARPLAVSFVHRPPPSLAPFRAAMGVEPRFAAERTEVVYPASVLALPLPGAKPALARALSAQLDGMLARVSAAQTTTQAVRGLVPGMLRAGGATAERVARRLGTGRRTLERRLADEGTSFRALIDEARLQLATEWLTKVGGTEVPIAEVAVRLGYSDVRAFDRAFRRWTNTTPSSWRRRRA